MNSKTVFKTKWICIYEDFIVGKLSKIPAIIEAFSKDELDNKVGHGGIRYIKYIGEVIV